MQASHGILTLCDPSPASHSTSPSGTQASRSMGPWQQASHACKPFSSPSTPPLCPPLTGLGMGAVGPSPRFIWRLGLRVSSRGLRFSLYPPLPEAPRPLRLSGPTSPWPTRLSPARSTHWCWCPIKVPIRGPQPATRLPLAGVTPPYSALLPHPLSCLNGAAGRHLVMRTGYRAPNRTPVVAAFTPSANFMFRIYRDLDPPYGLAFRSCRPPYVHYPLPLTLFFPLRIPL